MSVNMNSDENNNKKNEEVEFTYFKPVKRLALIFFAGFSVYLFISTMMLIFLTKSSAEVKVPDVTGKRFVDVSNSLTRKGFRTELKFVDVIKINMGLLITGGRCHPDLESLINVSVSAGKDFF